MRLESVLRLYFVLRYSAGGRNVNRAAASQHARISWSEKGATAQYSQHITNQARPQTT